MFPCGAFFLVFLRKCLFKYPSSTKPLLPWKMSRCLPAPSHYSFCKTLHLKYLTVFWIRLLNNCSVTCTVTLCLWPYDLMYSSLYPEILSIIVNSNIFRHIHVIFRHIQPHCSIFRTACNSCLLVYSVLCHIQNLSILSNWDVFRTVL